MTNQVYVISLNSHDYASLEEFGPPLFMTRGILDLRNHVKYEAMMETHIKNSNPSDYLMFNGPSLMCGIALKLWLKQHPTAKVLIFNGVRNKYTCYEIER